MERERMLTEVDPSMNELTSQVIGAAIEVHRHLGPGYLEETYQKAMEIELNLRGIQFSPQHPIHLLYKGVPVGLGRLDLLVAGRLVVELKAVADLAPVHRAQVMAYLKVTGLQLGLLLNFHVATMKEGIRRVIWTDQDV